MVAFAEELECKWAHYSLIIHFKHRTILRRGLAVIVNLRRCDIRMPQPFLHLGDIAAPCSHL